MVQGFHSKDELELMMQRRTSRSSLKSAKINNDIVERSYQHEAIEKSPNPLKTKMREEVYLLWLLEVGKLGLP